MLCDTPTFLHSSLHTHTHTHTHTRTHERSKMLNLVTDGRCSPRLTASKIQTKGAGATKTLLLVRQYVVQATNSPLVRPVILLGTKRREKQIFYQLPTIVFTTLTRTHTQGHAQIRQGQLLVDFSCAFTVQTIIHSEILND